MELLIDALYERYRSCEITYEEFELELKNLQYFLDHSEDRDFWIRAA